MSAAGPDALGYEFFRIALGDAVVDESGYETDLFAGL